MVGTIPGDVDEITLRLYVEIDMGSLDGSLDSYNDGKLDDLLRE